MPEIARVFEENLRVYGVRKVWRQLKREGHDLARCTVARLMRGMGLQGVILGKPARTTISDKAAPCPMNHMNRQFKAPRPNALWISDFTYVATWSGFAHVAFIIDAYARRIVGWRVSRTRAALAAAKARGKALGGDRGYRPPAGPDAAAATQARREAADRAAHRLGLEVDRLRAEGVEGHAALARALTARRVPTPHAAEAWTHTTIARVLGRVSLPPPAARPSLKEPDPPARQHRAKPDDQ